MESETAFGTFLKMELSFNFFKKFRKWNTEQLENETWNSWEMKHLIIFNQYKNWKSNRHRHWKTHSHTLLKSWLNCPNFPRRSLAIVVDDDEKKRAKIELMKIHWGLKKSWRKAKIQFDDDKNDNDIPRIVAWFCKILKNFT